MNVSSSGTRTGDYGGVARVEGTPFEMFHVISGRNVFRKGASTRRVAGQTDVSRQADRVHARVLLQDPEPSGAENFAQAEWARAKRILGRLFNAYLLLYMPSPDEPAPTPEWRASCEVAMPAFLQHFNTGLLATIEQVADRVTRYLIPYDSDLIRILGISASECIEICAWINDHLQQTLDDVADRVDAAKREHNMLRQASVTQISSPRPDHFTASMRPEFAGVFSSLQKVGIISLQDLQVAFPEKGLTF